MVLVFFGSFGRLFDKSEDSDGCGSISAHLGLSSSGSTSTSFYFGATDYISAIRILRQVKLTSGKS